MDISNFIFTNGYVGSMGKSWKKPTEAEFEACVKGAMQMEDKSREEVIAALSAGGYLKWCYSPNHTYDHSFGQIGTPKNKTPSKTVMCDCGHEVPEGSVMNASLGTSCFDCYDRMSG